VTIKHLFGRKDIYLISTDYGSEEGRPSWQYRALSLHTPRTESRVEWNLFDRGFGYGFIFGRNGDGSDVGLDLYGGRLFSIWLRTRTPWTKRFRVQKDDRPGHDPHDYLYARKTGLKFFPHQDCYLQILIEDREGVWTRGQPWWRDISLGKTQLFGKTESFSAEVDKGETMVPLPEGNYLATWSEVKVTNRYLGRLGRLRDRILGPRHHSYVDLDIPLGIPIEGKGENSWDCGMDGLFGCGGQTLEEAVGNAVKSVLRDRRRYGGPHDLERPMGVAEAESR
jgi:hypothetical protein